MLLMSKMFCNNLLISSINYLLLLQRFALFQQMRQSHYFFEQASKTIFINKFIDNMANKHGYDLGYVVYKIVGSNQGPSFEMTNTLVQIKSFDEEDGAHQWIIEEGERQVDYTIVKVYRTN
jgi:hypothetical protein